MPLPAPFSMPARHKQAGRSYSLHRNVRDRSRSSIINGKVIRSKAGIGALRVHDLRHQFASVAVSNGIDLRLVGQLLGHHDIDSTLGYAHLATDALMKSATRVSGLIDRSLRGQGTGTARVPGKYQRATSPKADAAAREAHRA